MNISIKITQALAAFDFFQLSCYYTVVMKYLEAIPERCSGALTIKGTRIRVSRLLKLVISGMSYEQIHTEWYPHLSASTLRGAVEEAITQLSEPFPTHA